MRFRIQFNLKLLALLQSASLQCGSVASSLQASYDVGKSWMVGESVLKDATGSQLVWEMTVFAPK